MSEEKTSKRSLDIQKLQLDLENHTRQDDRIYLEFKTILKNIDDKLTAFILSFNTHTTELAVLKANFESHLKTHTDEKIASESHQKNDMVKIGTILTVLTILINLGIWALNHFVLK
mgnify:FL=1